MDDNKLEQLGLKVTFIDEFVKGAKMIPRKVKLAPLSFKRIVQFGSWNTENAYRETMADLQSERDRAVEEYKSQNAFSPAANKLAEKIGKLDGKITKLEGKWERASESKKATATPKLKGSLDEAKSIYNQFEEFSASEKVEPANNDISDFASKFQSFKQEPFGETMIVEPTESSVEEKKPDIDQYLNNEFRNKTQENDIPEMSDMTDQLETRREEVETFKNELAQGRVASNSSYSTTDFFNNTKKGTKEDAMEAISKLLPEYQEIMAPVFEAEKAREEDLNSLQDTDDELKETMDENHKIIEMNKDADRRLNHMREVLVKHAEKEKARITKDRERIQADKKAKQDKILSLNDNIEERRSQYATTSKELADLEDAFRKLEIPVEEPTKRK